MFFSQFLCFLCCISSIMCLVKHGPATKVKVNPEVVGIIGGLATTASSSKGSHHWSTAKAAGSTAKPAQSATKAAGSTAKAAGNTVKTAPCAAKAAPSTAKAAHAPTTRKSRIRPLVPHRAVTPPPPPCPHYSDREPCRQIIRTCDGTVVDKKICTCDKKLQCKLHDKTEKIQNFLCDP